MTTSHAEEAFACAELTSFPVGENEALVSFGRGTGPLRVPRPVATALAELGKFRTKSEHARVLAETARASQDEIAALLGGLPLLARSDVLRAAFEAGDPRSAPARRVEHLGFVTCNRPVQLEESLRIALRKLEEHARSVEIVICDDSSSGDVRADVIARLKRVQQTTSMPIRYAGLAEKHRFAAVLAKEVDAPLALLHFGLLDPFETRFCLGANRNVLTLDTVGSTLLSLDDDVHVRLATADIASARAALVITDERAPELQLDSRVEVERAVQEVPDCPLRSVEEMLGRRVADLIRETQSPDRVDIEHIDRDLRELLRAGRGIVRVVSFGLWGDTGGDGPEMNLFLPRSARERLLSSEADYRRAMRSREIVRTYGAPAITKPFPHMPGFVMALDQSVELPPFLPVLRGEDWTFAYLMNITQPEDVLGLSRHLLHHAAARSGSYERPLGSTAPPFPAIVGAMLSMVHDGRGPHPTLAAVGRHLSNVGALDDKAFEDLCRVRLVAAETTRIAALEELVAEHGHRAPHWARDVELVIARARERIATARYSEPPDLRATRSPRLARDTARRMVGRFGELLEAWPHLRAAARTLRSRGERASRPVPSL